MPKRDRYSSLTSLSPSLDGVSKVLAANRRIRPNRNQEVESSVSSMKYKVVLQQSDEGIRVSVPGLPGCWSRGATETDALANIRDAIREYLRSWPSRQREPMFARLRSRYRCRRSPGSHMTALSELSRKLASELLGKETYRHVGWPTHPDDPESQSSERVHDGRHGTGCRTDGR